jgi:hypothetical protein
VSKPEKIIEEALIHVRSKGIHIIMGGAMYNWCDASGKMAEIPTACDAFGAVMIHHGIAQPDFPKGWMKQLCEILGTNGWWLWRFNMGFAHRNPVTFLKKDERSKKWIEIADDVSPVGIKLSKRYVGND